MQRNAAQNNSVVIIEDLHNVAFEASSVDGQSSRSGLETESVMPTSIF